MVSAVLEIPYRDTTPHSASMPMAGSRRMADTDSMASLSLKRMYTCKVDIQFGHGICTTLQDTRIQFYR